MPDAESNHKDIISLREFICEKIHALREETILKFRAEKEAKSVALKAMDNRLNGMNELRESMRDLTGLMLTRLEHEVYLKKVDSDREVLKQELCGRILIIEKSINSLELSAAKQEGKASQESVSRVQLLAYIGVIISLTFGLSAIILRLVGI
jgi:hypothetical protein